VEIKLGQRAFKIRMFIADVTEEFNQSPGVLRACDVLSKIDAEMWRLLG
jgi:hypothetical protein